MQTSNSHSPANAGDLFIVQQMSHMTTKTTEVTTASFPPVDDAVSFFKNIDWADVRQRSIKGVNNCGIVIAVIGEKVNDLGMFLACFGAEDI